MSLSMQLARLSLAASATVVGNAAWAANLNFGLDSGPTKAPIELKGIKPGIALEALRNAMPELACPELPLCTYSTEKAPNDTFSTLAGKSVESWRIEVAEGVASEITAILPWYVVLDLFDSMVDKYGAPRSGRVAGEFVDVRWENSGGELRLNGFHAYGSKTRVTLTSAATLAKRRATELQKREAKKKDL